MYKVIKAEDSRSEYAVVEPLSSKRDQLFREEQPATHLKRGRKRQGDGHRGMRLQSRERRMNYFNSSASYDF